MTKTVTDLANIVVGEPPVGMTGQSSPLMWQRNLHSIQWRPTLQANEAGCLVRRYALSSVCVLGQVTRLSGEDSPERQRSDYDRDRVQRHRSRDQPASQYEWHRPRYGDTKPNHHWKQPQTTEHPQPPQVSNECQYRSGDARGKAPFFDAARRGRRVRIGSPRGPVQRSPAARAETPARLQLLRSARADGEADVRHGGGISNASSTVKICEPANSSRDAFRGLAYKTRRAMTR